MDQLYPHVNPITLLKGLTGQIPFSSVYWLKLATIRKVRTISPNIFCKDTGHFGLPCPLSINQAVKVKEISLFNVVLLECCGLFIKCFDISYGIPLKPYFKLQTKYTLSVMVPSISSGVL